MNDSLFHRIQQTDPEKLQLLVEISKGDYNKYEFNHEYGVLELDRVLYGPIFYPVNYCDVPGTWNEGDDDPLDAVVFATKEIVPGALVTGRVIGALEMIDNDEVDHKIICVADKDPRYEHVKSVDDLTPYERKDLKSFFELYKIPQTGKDTVKVGKFFSKDEALKLVEESVDCYKKKFKK